MNLKKLLKTSSIFIIIAIVFVFTACDEPAADNTPDVIKTGTPTTINGKDYTIVEVDPAGGYIAEREDGKVKALSGYFTKDIKLTADTTWELYRTVFIGYDSESQSATLTIEPGTVIKGIPGVTPGLLVVTRYSKIIAVGTKDKPIVFTSGKAQGQRAPGDWGGLVINGRARINEGTNVLGEGNSGPYGGDDDADSSGTLIYVRVEFAGHVFTGEDELNGIAFQAVGSGTTVDYVQVHQNLDDGIEFFGGNVSVSHAVVTGCVDDSFDWTSGWRGSAQYVVIQHYPGTGDRGIEADNLESPTDAEPISNPTLANFTMIGNDSSDVGILLRRGTKVSLYNSIISNFAPNDKNGDGVYTGSIEQDGASVDDVYYNGICADTPLSDDKDIIQNAADFASGAGNTDTGMPNLTAAAVATDIGGTYSFNAKPSAAPVGSSAQALPAELDSAGAGFVGAVNPAGVDWTEGWITNIVD